MKMIKTYVEAGEYMLKTALRGVDALSVAVVQERATHEAPLCKSLQELSNLQELSV